MVPLPFPQDVTALIDNGPPPVLIDEGLVTRLGLRRRWVPPPRRVGLTMEKEEVVSSEWVKLCVYSEDQEWTACVARAIVAPNLANPVLLGDPFLDSKKNRYRRRA